MKNKSNNHTRFKKQLISGTIYTALAAVVVAVTVNTTVGVLSGHKVELPNAVPQNTALDLPDFSDLPKIEIPEIINDISGVVSENEKADTAPVSETGDGVTADIIESLSQSLPDLQDTPEPISIPDDAYLGIDRFIKPCDGYVSKEHSADVPVYSTTLSDYRIHIGVDVTGDIGTPVAAVTGGIVTDIYTDDLYGKTVCIQTKDGYTVKYSNLLDVLNANVTVGSLITTGQTIGGIGDTALCEAVEASHLHLEMYDSTDTPVDPEDFISF